MLFCPNSDLIEVLVSVRSSSPDEKDLQQMTYLDKTWNQQDKTRWKNKTETFSSRLNVSYQFDDNNSFGASFSFLRNPKLITDGKTEGSVLRDEDLTETNTSIRSEFGQNSNLSSNIYYVGKVGKLVLTSIQTGFGQKETIKTI